MAGTDLNQKFTIEKYCTRNEVAKALGTNLIDPFWREIIEFRRNFAYDLPLFDAAHAKFGLTYLDSVQGKAAQANDRATKYGVDVKKLSPHSVSEFSFRREMLINSLRVIAKINRIDVSDITLSNIVEGHENGEEYKVLIRYFKSLKSLKENSYDNIDDSFLAKHYAILRGEEELTSFYRENDIDSASSKFLVDKEYDNGVPSHLIDEMMGTLFDYINRYDVSLVTRISAIFFMFNYVKPFESYNMELACLLAKRVLASTSIDTDCVYVPLELFLNNREFFNEVSKEVKKTHDFTYAFISASDVINDSFDLALNKISQVHGSSLDEEVKLGGEEKQIKKEFGPNVNIPVRKEQKKSETKAEILKRHELSADINDEVHLSEKELKAKMNDLLEIDPNLKKSQAHFYVHHCTKGRYYTIQQFVKFEGCVYETGRTSMDDLAKLGYYRRDQIKNKFVYTPIYKE